MGDFMPSKESQDVYKRQAISVQNILNENMLTAQQQAIVNHLPATFTTAQAHDVAKENDMKSRTCLLYTSGRLSSILSQSHAG